MLLDVLRKWARVTPHKPAVGFNGNEFSYLQFVRLIETCRRCLQSYSLPRGSIAVVNTGMQLDGWVILIAARSLGLTTIVLPDLDKASDLNLRNVSCVLQIQMDPRDVSSTVSWLTGARLIVLPVSAFSYDGELDVRDLDAQDAGGHIVLTSGSTGRPKKCMFLKEHEAALLADSPPMAFGGRVSLQSFALFSAVPFKKSLYIWGRGGFVSYDQRGWGAILSDPGLTDICYVPPAELPALAKAVVEAKICPSGLNVFVGGGILSWQPVASARLAPGCRLFNSYSATERRDTFLTPLLSPEDSLWHIPADASTVEIVDSDGQPVGAGVEGFLKVKLLAGDFDSYFDDEAASASMFRDGYFYPGDLAVRREDGRIRMLGRLADVLIIGGNKYNAAELEELLAQKLHVDTVCLFATQTDLTEPEVFVAVESARLPSAENIKSVNSWLTSFHNVHFTARPRLPRLENGKIDRINLRAQLVSAARLGTSS